MGGICNILFTALRTHARFKTQNDQETGQFSLCNRVYKHNQFNQLVRNQIQCTIRKLNDEYFDLEMFGELCVYMKMCLTDNRKLNRINAGVYKSVLYYTHDTDDDDDDDAMYILCCCRRPH